MVAAIAFACIQSDGVAVRRVQFTAEFKACLPFLRFSGLGHEPIDTVPIEAAESARDGSEQHLRIAHAATAAITLPPLAFLRYVSDGPGADPTIYLRAFGICLLDRGAPSRPASVFSRGEFRAMERPLDRLADVVDHVVRYGEHRSGDGDSPFRFAASRTDPLGERAALEGVADLRVVAPRKVRALLLAEPPSYGRECRLRLYIDTNRPRASVPAMRDYRARLRASR